MLLTAASLASWPWFPGVRAPFADTWVARLVLTRPESRGTIWLASADPAAAPRVRQNMLSRDADWQALRSGVRQLDDIARQPAMARFTAGRLSPAEGPLGTAEIDAHIRATAITVHHPLGTCRMGPSPDEGAVVGPDLRVHGCEGVARDRRLGHAGRRLRQHQRGGDHDRREGGRSDPRPVRPGRYRITNFDQKTILTG